MRLTYILFVLMLMMTQFLFAGDILVTNIENSVEVSYSGKDNKDLLLEVPNTGRVNCSWNITLPDGTIYKGMGNSHHHLMSTPAIYRDIRVVALNLFDMSDIESITLMINADNSTLGLNEKNDSNNISKSYNRIYKDNITNYTPQRNTMKDKILYYYPANVQDYVIELGNWKERTGFDVVYRPLNDVTNNTAWIQDSIQQEYDSDYPPSYVVLFGDVDGDYSIPTFWYDYATGSAEGDHPYTLLEGDDPIEDIAIGRISFSSTSELATIINKIIMYEGMQYVPLGWQNRVLLVSDTDESGITTLTTNQYVKEIMTEYNPDFEFIELIGTDPSVSLVTANLNMGISYFNYRGFLGMSGWDAYEAFDLLNGPRLPIVSTVTCDTGSFGNGLSRTEAFLRAGTPQLPAGAVASFGCSTADTHTCYNNLVDASFYEGLFVHDMTTIGEALTYAKNQLFTVYANSQPEMLDYNYQIFNLMGDPTTIALKGSPRQFNVDISSYGGGRTLPVTITGLDGQQYYYSVCSEAEGIIASGYSNEESLTLPVGADSATVKLLVLSDGYKPVEHVVSVGNGATFLFHNTVVAYGDIETDLLYPNIEASIDIECSANNLEYGIFQAEYELINNKGEIIHSGQTEFINNDIACHLNNYLSLPAFSKQQLTDRLLIRCSVECYGNPTFDAEIDVFTGSINISHRFDNTNGIEAILGETTRLVIDMGNPTPNDFTVDWLSSGNEGLQYINTNVIDADTCTQYYNFHCEASLEPNMVHYIPITLQATQYNGIQFSWTEYIEFPVIYRENTSYFDNTGQYSIYTSVMQNAPELINTEWVELNPQLGGAGINTGIVDEIREGDQTVTLDLPFAFSWYGEEFDTISICSNGWISMGETPQITYRNWRFPGPLGPANMIAPFWDDLITTDGGVFTYYDPTNERFIVEWDCKARFDDTIERFQMQMFTSGEVLFIYDDVTAVDDTYQYRHGSYFTTGFEGANSTQGFEYVFGNEYVQGATEVSNGLKLLIKEADNQQRTAFLPVSYYYLNMLTDQQLDLVIPICSLEGDFDVSLVLDENQNWLNIASLDNCNVVEGERSEINLSVSSNGLEPGEYNTTVGLISDNLSIHGLQIPIILYVSDIPLDEMYSIAQMPNIDFIHNSDTNITDFNGFIKLEDYFRGAIISYNIELNPFATFVQIEDGFVSFSEDVDQNYSVLITANSEQTSASGQILIRAFEDVDDEDNVQTPQTLGLTNYPNPFNPTTTISFSLEKKSTITLSIYNIKGQLINELAEDMYSQGTHTIEWDGAEERGKRVTSGIYFIRLKTSDSEVVRKVALIK